MSQCVYICGAGHSGSTLLDMLLGSHSQVTSLGEISNLPMDWAVNNKCTCGHPVHECALWSDVMRQLGSITGFDVAANPYALNLGPIYAAVGDKRVTGKGYLARRKVISALHYFELRYGASGVIRPLLRNLYAGLENTLKLYDLVGQALQSEWVVDSSKVYSRAVALYKLDPRRMKIILLIRDGRAVYYSMRKRNFDRRYSLDSWYLTFRRALPLIERHVRPEDVIQVKYEDLANAPAGELMRICSFAGLEFQPGMLEFKSKVHHNINGNDMRFSSASEIRLDTKWQTALSGDDLEYFNQHAGWLNEKFGYR